MKLMIALGVILLCSTASIAQDRDRDRQGGPGVGVEIGPGGVQVVPRPRPDDQRYGRQRCRTVVTTDEDTGRRTRRRVCGD
jgi:hypothetical protein